MFPRDLIKKPYILPLNALCIHTYMRISIQNCSGPHKAGCVYPVFGANRRGGQSVLRIISQPASSTSTVSTEYMH